MYLRGSFLIDMIGQIPWQVTSLDFPRTVDCWCAGDGAQSEWETDGKNL